jgi:hypothetical protein
MRSIGVPSCVPLVKYRAAAILIGTPARERIGDEFGQPAAP